MKTQESAARFRVGFVRSSSMVSRLCRAHALPREEETKAERFAQLAKGWWENLASRQDWLAAAELGEMSTAICPQEAFAWENWAWALHKQGRTREAYKVLSPILKKLKLPGPPSGRAAYCLACFCAVLGKKEEGVRWLRLAYLRAVSKDAFRFHVLGEPDLQDLWPDLLELQ